MADDSKQATDADIFELTIGNTDGIAKFGGDTRVTSRVVAKPKLNNFQIVNVFDYRIFANDLNNILKQKLPFVFIEEYSIVSNSLINQFRYFGDIIRYDEVVGGIKQTARVIGDATIGLDNIKSAKDNIEGLASWIGSIYSRTADAIGAVVPAGVASVAASAGALAGGVADALNPKNILPFITPNINESSFDEQLLGPSLKPYSGLYQTQPTGFRYIMPYFDNKMHNINNKFVDNFTGFMGVETQPLKNLPNVFKAGADMVKSVGEAFLSIPRSLGGGGAYNAPSTYVEIPQYFAAGEYDSYTVTFDLLNTFDFKDIQKNYDLIFLLAFQNLPYREDIVNIVPPKIYTLLIPGQIFLPYCHMKSIKVDYIGNRRQVEIKKFINKTGITTNILPKEEQNIIVPDCYRVSIEFLSMVKPSSNFMLTPDIKVTESSSLITSAEILSQTTPKPPEKTAPIAPTTTTSNTNLPSNLVFDSQSNLNQNLNRILRGESIAPPTISNNIIQNTNNIVSGQLQQILQSQR